VKLADFDYELPPGRIAQEPLVQRDRARLLVHRVAADETQHRAVRELVDLLDPGDLLVVNDTRVLASRLFARRASGGRIELFLVEPAAAPERAWQALVHPARRLRPDERLELEGGFAWVRMHERPRRDDGSLAMEWIVTLEDAAGATLDPRAVFERAGHVPLPPYVERPDRPEDAQRYQTVYAVQPGAVAAPTAGLHFTPELLAALETRGVRRAAVTLHVGPGTFQPVKVERVEEHRMHAERFVLPQATVDAVRATRAAGKRVVAVGTTVVRVLESCAGSDGELSARAGTTDLFLWPGARFRVVDALLTNFHLPRSTLLMLVCAFAGRERVLRLYREAIELGYRFYSYGDAMLLL
jgi:S-adenosylmethionine:tRNA ribosyltransferase-isomerase